MVAHEGVYPGRSYAKHALKSTSTTFSFALTAPGTASQSEPLRPCSSPTWLPRVPAYTILSAPRWLRLGASTISASSAAPASARRQANRFWHLSRHGYCRVRLGRSDGD